MTTSAPPKKIWTRLSPLWPILLLAASLRLFGLNSLPPGLNFDEAGNGVAALDILRGNATLWWTIGGGKEPLIAYALPPLIGAFGFTAESIRLYAALMGVLTVGTLYFFAGQAAYTWPSRRSVRLLASVAALGAATSFWLIAFSRLGFRAMALPAFSAMALGWWVLGWRRHKQSDFIWSGVWFGLACYTYLAGRLLPLVIVAFWLIQWRTGQLDSRRWAQLRAWAIALGLSLSPLVVHFALNPAQLSARAGAVSIFNPAVHQGDFWGLFLQTLGLTLGTFAGLSGDPNPIANLPGRAIFGVGQAVLFWLGVGLALRHWRRVAAQVVLLWWLIMLLPAILAPEGAPHHLRLLGTAPASYVLLSWGLIGLIDALIESLRRFIKTRFFERLYNLGVQTTQLISETRWAGLAWVLSLSVFAVIGWQSYGDYFQRWSQLDHHLTYDRYAVELAQQIAAKANPTSRFILPMDLRAADEARHYTLDFLLPDDDAFSYAKVDETTLGPTLTAAAQGANELQVVRWTQDKHREADAKGLLSFLLAHAGATLTAQEPAQVYTLEQYRLPGPATVFTFPPITHPVDITLDGLIQVRRSWVAPLLEGRTVGVAMTVAPIASLEADYRASVRLTGPEGQSVAQVDRTLRHNWHQPASLWPREEINSYFLLPLPPEAQPGQYQVHVVIYHPETLAPLTQNGLVEVPLGHVELPPTP